mmetsp:Transcript_33860/g.97235  ORF Transcript_33860/g.97235 Transcript_33860/m.97235 type:complete len:228 (-) Transcript_33860:46-729(-)
MAGGGDESIPVLLAEGLDHAGLHPTITTTTTTLHHPALAEALRAGIVRHSVWETQLREPLRGLPGLELQLAGHHLAIGSRLDMKGDKLSNDVGTHRRLWDVPVLKAQVLTTEGRALDEAIPVLFAVRFDHARDGLAFHHDQLDCSSLHPTVDALRSVEGHGLALQEFALHLSQVLREVLLGEHDVAAEAVAGDESKALHAIPRLHHAAIGRARHLVSGHDGHIGRLC